jgi:hypothetical protein
MQLMFLTWGAVCSIFVLMMLHGYPLSAKIPDDPGFGDRFWYWQGASGQSYIHSIYPIGSCPPLAGAVFILVKGLGGNRVALSVGCLPAQADRLAGQVTPMVDAGEATEIHVHLLARSDAAVQAIVRDLRGALKDEEAVGSGCSLSERGPVQLSLV